MKDTQKRLKAGLLHFRLQVVGFEVANLDVSDKALQ